MRWRTRAACAFDTGTSYIYFTRDTRAPARCMTRFIQDEAKQILVKNREKAHEAIRFAKIKTMTERM